MDDIRPDLIRMIVSDCQDEGYNNIYAPIPGYKEPFEISWKQNEQGAKPDVIAMNGDDVKLFTIENKMSRRVPKKKIKKWKMLGVYARAKKGKVCLVALNDTIETIKNAMDPVPDYIEFITVK